MPQEKLELYDKLFSGSEMEIKGKTLPYTSVNGNMFSFMDQDGNVSIRIPENEREKFMKKYKTRMSVQHGVTMKEYVMVPDSLLKKTAGLKKYIDMSFSYAQSLKSKSITRKK